MGTSLTPFILRETAAPSTPPSGSIALYSVDGSALLMKDDAGVIQRLGPMSRGIDFSHAGNLTVGSGVFRVPIIGGTWDIVAVDAMIDTAPTGASAIFDVNKNGTTIFGTQANRPTIAISGFDATVGTWSVTSVTNGDYLTVDVDQIGSTVAGANAVVSVLLARTA